MKAIFAVTIFIFTIAQEVRIAKVMGSNPLQAWIFFRPFLRYCSRSVRYCEDRFHIHVFIRSSNVWLTYIHNRLQSRFIQRLIFYSDVFGWFNWLIIVFYFMQNSFQCHAQKPTHPAGSPLRVLFQSLLDRFEYTCLTCSSHWSRQFPTE